jgi:hypothetical protein
MTTKPLEPMYTEKLVERVHLPARYTEAEWRKLSADQQIETGDLSVASATGFALSIFLLGSAFGLIAWTVFK